MDRSTVICCLEANAVALSASLRASGSLAAHLLAQSAFALYSTAIVAKLVFCADLKVMTADCKVKDWAL